MSGAFHDESSRALRASALTAVLTGSLLAGVVAGAAPSFAVTKLSDA